MLSSVRKPYTAGPRIPGKLYKGSRKMRCVCTVFRGTVGASWVEGFAYWKYSASRKLQKEVLDPYLLLSRKVVTPECIHEFAR